MSEKKKYDGVHELSLEELDGASGGYIYSNGDDPEYPYELIDDKTGNVIAYFARRQDAVDSAKDMKLSTKDLSWDELKKLRKKSGIY